MVFTAKSANTILPTNPNIQYIGRFDNTNPLSPKMSWTASQIVAKFQGTSIKLIMNSLATTYFNLSIDNIKSVLTATTGNNIYTLASGLKDTIHTVTLFKRESPWQSQNFNGFVLDDGKMLVNPPVRKIRKIEFYGDSQTQGAQAEVSNYGNDMGSAIYDNAFNSYAGITARALRAEYVCIARSGATLSPYSSKVNIPSIFHRTGTDSISSTLWDFSNWQSDVVCVNLGENDSPFPTDFSARYVSFVNKIRAKYPNAYVFLLFGPMSQAAGVTVPNSIQDAVNILNAQGDKKVYFLKFSKTLTHSGHPRVADHLACAKELVAKIQTVIWGGPDSDTSVGDVYMNQIPANLTTTGTQQLTASVTPFYALDQKVYWKSSDLNVLKVDSSGLVTALSAGNAIITVTTRDGQKTASTQFLVSTPVIGNLVVNHGFESPLTLGWTGDWGNSKLNTTTTKSGSAALEIGPNSGGRDQWLYSGFIAGNSYTMSAWCKILTGTPISFFAAKCIDENGANTTFTSDHISSTTSFEQMKFTFKIPANTVAIQFYIWMGTPLSSIVIDDFECVAGNGATEINLPKSDNQQVLLFPNPLKGGLLNINIQGLIGDKNIIIMDTSGRSLFSQKLQDEEMQMINLSNLQLKGLFIVRLTSNNKSISQLLEIQ